MKVVGKVGDEGWESNFDEYMCECGQGIGLNPNDPRCPICNDPIKWCTGGGYCIREFPSHYRESGWILHMDMVNNVAVSHEKTACRMCGAEMHERDGKTDIKQSHLHWHECPECGHNDWMGGE